MSQCQHCGRDVKKLLDHPFTKEQVCLKCITRSGFFSRGPSEEGIIIQPSERRSNIRVPVTIVMSFEMFDSATSAHMDYAAYSVNLTTHGICFAWENCKQCYGYEEGGIHPNCVFHPFSLNNPAAKPLVLTFKLTEDYTMHLPCNIVYTVQEQDMDIEYVGAKFTEVSTEEKRILEIIIHKYGRLS